MTEFASGWGAALASAAFRACLACLLMCGACHAEAAGPGQIGASECRVATTGNHAVTVHDAELVRALVAPPPTRGEAARFAVTVTAAFVAAYPGRPVPDISRRLTTYRRLVERHGAEVPLAPVEPGACWAGAART